MHLHQTHRGSEVLTPENGERYFLIIIFWWLACLLPSQTCVERYLPAARRNWQIILRSYTGAACIGTWTRALLCGKDPA